MDERTQADIVEACRRGDRDALEAVFRAHAPAIERTLRRLVGPGADVEDLLQETLIAAIGAFPRFRGDASIGTWLTGIALGVVRNWFRRPAQRRRVALELVPPLESLSEGRPTPDVLAHDRRLLERLYVHLDALTHAKRFAFVLHVLEGRPLREVASVMGASLVATKSRVFWARQWLLVRARRDPMLRDFFHESGRRRTP